jgi:putative membrane protein
MAVDQNTTNSSERVVEHSAKTVEQHSNAVARTARVVQHSSEAIEDSATRTTRLAADRTILAAERTFAAWVRTGLFALTTGVGARALLTGLMPEWLVLADSSLLVVFSAFCFGAAVWRYFNPGPPPPAPNLPTIPRALLVTVGFFLALVSLAALVGIWTRVRL